MKKSPQQDYWEEVLYDSFEEHGVKVSEETVTAIATDIRLAHENYGLAFYSPPCDNRREVDALKKALSDEKSKIICAECNGRGSYTIRGPYHWSESTCCKCRGEGRHLP